MLFSTQISRISPVVGLFVGLSSWLWWCTAVIFPTKRRVASSNLFSSSVFIILPLTLSRYFFGVVSSYIFTHSNRNLISHNIVVLIFIHKRYQLNNNKTYHVPNLWKVREISSATAHCPHKKIKFNLRKRLHSYSIKVKSFNCGRNVLLEVKLLLWPNFHLD